MLSIALDTQCDIGVDAGKTKQAQELPLLNSGLQSQLEETWEQLQLLAVLPSDCVPKVDWIEPDSADAQAHQLPSSLIDQWDRLELPLSQSA